LPTLVIDVGRTKKFSDLADEFFQNPKLGAGGKKKKRRESETTKINNDPKGSASSHSS
jgi:hypothetical protein